MRVLLPFSLLSLVWAATQQVFERPPDSEYPARKTLVSLLAEDEQFSVFLRACQRARLVPLLNRLNGSTLFAPTNEAIRRADGSEDALWPRSSAARTTSSLSTSDRDNLQLELRETILYHLLNYTIIDEPTNGTTVRKAHRAPPLDERPKLYETLWHPTLRNETFEEPPTLPGTPSDPDPDWPRGRRGQLSWEGERLRISRTGDTVYVGEDAKGRGALRARVKRARWAKNGVLLPLDGVLAKPRNISATLSTMPELSTFTGLMPPALLEDLATARHTTLFAPTNEAWTALSELEMRFLRSGFAQAELSQILQDVVSRAGTGNNKTIWLEPLARNRSQLATKVPTLGNQTLELSMTTDNAKVEVNGSTIETADVLCSNGVIHTVPSLLLPTGSLALTAEKYLIALNATRFVSLLRSVDLSSYVQLPPDSEEGFTILAPNDEVAQIVIDRGLGSGQPLPSPGSHALAELLKYHILPGSWDISDLEDGQLLKTELSTPALRDARQRLPVSIRRESTRIEGRRRAIVTLGNAGILGQPVTVGKSIIYILTAILEPPASLINTAVPDLRLSTFTAATYAADLAERINSARAVTALAPTNNAFAALGLTLSYLLLPSSKTDLRNVVKYHVIDGIQYGVDLKTNSSRALPTLDGALIYANSSDHDVAFHGPSIGSQLVNGNTRDAAIVEGDILTSNGVMHIIDQVVMPPSVDITISKLMLGARATIMADLVRVANLTWVLEGVDKTHTVAAFGLNKGHKKKKKRKTRPGNTIDHDTPRSYTLLCPTDKAFSGINLTYYYESPAALVSLIRLHVIPTDAFEPFDGPEVSQPITLDDKISYRTLHDKTEGGSSDYGQVVFSKWGNDGWMVAIKSARGAAASIDTARVISYGRATPKLLALNETDGAVAVTQQTRLVRGGGVISIDAVLMPYEPGWFLRWGWIVMAAVLSLAGVGLIVALSWKLWREKKTRDGYEVVEGEED